MPRKKKCGKDNTLVCTIPGLRKPIEIAFDSKKLPVCKKCKKIYKTRQLCRVRDGHTDLPWCTTYICFQVDDSCLLNGRFTQSDDDKFVAELSPDEKIQTPYFADLDKLGPNPPICRNCKDKNYTRYHCRTNHSHRNLPWGTFYATLKRVENGDVTTALSADSVVDVDSIDGGLSVPNLESPNPEEKGDGPETENASLKRRSNCNYGPEVESSKRMKSGNRWNQPCVETVNQVNESKTFILIIHEENISLHWLKINPSSDNEIPICSSVDSHNHHETVATHDRAHGNNGNPYRAPYYDENYSSMYDSRNPYNSSHQFNNYPSSQFIQQPAANGNNEDVNAIEPVPYSPFALRGYKPNEYYRPNESGQMNPASYNDRTSYAASVGGRANTSQYDGYPQQQLYNPYNSQIQAQYDYRQPPSPQQRLNRPAEFGYNSSDAHGRNSSGNHHQHYTNQNQSRGYYGNDSQHQYQHNNYQYCPSREKANVVKREDAGSMNDRREKNEGVRNEQYQNWNKRQHDYNYQCVPNSERGNNAESEGPKLNVSGERNEGRKNDQSQNETDLTSWTDGFLVDTDTIDRNQHLGVMEGTGSVLSLAGGGDESVFISPTLI